MTKFSIGDEIIYKGRMDRKGFIYKIADAKYWVREPDVPWGTPGAHFFRLNIYNDPYIQLYSDFLDGIVTPTPTPAKGDVYNLDYPANAKNGETITIKASVLNKGGTSGEFSLRLIAAPQMVLVTRYVGWVSPYGFSVLESLSVTMPSSGASANLGIQCIRHT